MLISALMHASRENAEALFGGAGYVPNILSLQAWLESAWAAGFDQLGCAQMGSSMQGAHKWIGTTEVAALLRYFGIRAHIVDFYGSHNSPDARIRPDGLEEHPSVRCDVCGMQPIVGPRFTSDVVHSFDVCGRCYAGHLGALQAAPYRRVIPLAPTDPRNRHHHPADRCRGGSPLGLPGEGHRHMLLMYWVWQYFKGELLDTESRSNTDPERCGEQSDVSQRTQSDLVSRPQGNRMGG
jgi:hypothetical protein